MDKPLEFKFWKGSSDEFSLYNIGKWEVTSNKFIIDPDNGKDTINCHFYSKNRDKKESETISFKNEKGETIVTVNVTHYPYAPIPENQNPNAQKVQDKYLNNQTIVKLPPSQNY